MWSRNKFWMSLGSDHIGMIFYFDDLREKSIGRCRRDDKSSLFHRFTIHWIKLKTMSMSLGYLERTIDFFSQCSWSDNTWIRPKSHISTLRCESFLMIHDMDDILFSFRGKFLTGSILHTENIPSKLDRHDLRSETYTQIWNHIGTCIVSS